MRRKQFEQLIDAMSDALAYAEGDTSRGVTHAVPATGIASGQRATGSSEADFAPISWPDTGGIEGQA